VRIIGTAELYEFARKHAGARKPLANWEKVVRAAVWKNSEEMKRTFGSVDYDDPRTIFDLAGNRVRLIALVDFKKQLIHITGVMTHAEYDKGKWK
jgi:mRNA interferase HigB